MKRPKTIRVGAFDYRVELEPTLAEKAGVLGLCVTDNITIYLDGNMPDPVEAETLLHEALHAMWTQTTLDKMYTDEQEEAIIHSLSPAIFLFLQENRDYLRWAMDGSR
jgi:hypothetical protein